MFVILDREDVVMLVDVLAMAASRRAGRDDGKATDAEVRGLSDVYKGDADRAAVAAVLDRLLDAYGVSA